MKNALLALSLSIASLLTDAQVQKTVLVEHFTNTNCGNCGRRNPGLIDNLKNNPAVLHMAVHPSRPYASCILSQHNAVENDDRAKYNNVFGSTPRIVINGDVVSKAFNATDLFSPYDTLKSSFSISATVSGNVDTVFAEVSIFKEAAESFNDLALHVFVVEDTVFYDAPNGEKQHHNVFRKRLTPDAGLVVGTTNTVGDSLNFSVGKSALAGWDLNRMRVIAVLQNPSDKELVQAKQSDYMSSFSGPTSISETAVNSVVRLFPNPSSKNVALIGLALTTEFQILDLAGNTVHSGVIDEQESFDVNFLSTGFYTVKYTNEIQSGAIRFVKQ